MLAQLAQPKDESIASTSLVQILAECSLSPICSLSNKPLPANAAGGLGLGLMLTPSSQCSWGFRFGINVNPF